MIPAGAIDTHAHVFAHGLPLAPGRRYTPAYDADPEEYLGLLTRAGVAGGVLAQPSFLGAENGFLLSCLDRWPKYFRGIVVLRPDGCSELDALAARGVVGARLNLLGQDVPNLSGRSWRAFGVALARYGQHLELQALGSQWHAIAPQLRCWPSPIVVDHLGLPGVDLAADRIVVDLASRDHVWMKVSGPYRSPAGAASVMLAELLERCGPTRLIWGSDWPWTRHEAGRRYQDTVDWLSTRLDEGTFHQILARNPQRLLNWVPYTERSVTEDASSREKGIGSSASDQAEPSQGRADE